MDNLEVFHANQISNVLFHIRTKGDGTVKLV